MSAAPKNQYRLPTNVKPLHYDLTVLTDLKSQQFEGFVKITLDVKEETSSIVLNADDLELGQAWVYHNDHKIQVTHSFDITKKRASFVLPTGFRVQPTAQIKLEIPFKADLANSMTGYYKSSSGGTLVALTQFEPVDARRAFPCWDEPALKATYKITMISRKDTDNISNMAVDHEALYNPLHQDELSERFPRLATSKDEWKVTSFQKSPLMSSYLVAYANGPFKHLETSAVSPLTGKVIPLRVYTTTDVIYQAQFVLDVMAQLLPLYEEVFSVEYPLPKLDILVAADFDAGAMENWGLITGRTNAFLLDPKNPDIQTKKRVVTFSSHEVAHQWFGNITTMEVCDIDGRSNYTKIFPEFRPNSAFINEHLGAALALDAKFSSHPVEVECPDADQVGQIFDDLSYSKAASVLRMLANHVGEDRFLKGVSLYLKDHLYANTVTDDLWKGIGKATGLDISHLMDNWITKTGYPVISVTETKNGIRVRQNRFLETGIPSPEDDSTLWNVPLAILMIESDTGKAVIDNSVLLEQREQTIPLDTTQVFKLNAGTCGVYRVLYTEERLLKIGHEAAKSNTCLSLDDRMGLVTDAMALSKAGLAKVSSALSLVDILRNEGEYLVWAGIVSDLRALSSVWWEYPEIVAKLCAFRRSLFAPIVQRLGYEFSPSDSADTTELRRCAIDEAASAGDEQVIAELKSRFENFLKTGDESRIPADLQRSIYRTAVQFGGVEEYNAVLKIHNNPKTPTSGLAAILALGSTRDLRLLDRTFQTIMTGCRDQDVVYFFRGLTQNEVARRPTATFFEKEYEALSHRFEKNFTLKDLVQATFAQFSSREDYDQTEAYFKDKDCSKYRMALDQSLDSIRARAQYIERSTEDLSQWLDEWSRLSRA